MAEVRTPSTLLGLVASMTRPKVPGEESKSTVPWRYCWESEGQKHRTLPQGPHWKPSQSSKQSVLSPSGGTSVSQSPKTGP